MRSKPSFRGEKPPAGLTAPLASFFVFIDFMSESVMGPGKCLVAAHGAVVSFPGFLFCTFCRRFFLFIGQRYIYENDKNDLHRLRSRARLDVIPLPEKKTRSGYVDGC